MDITLVQFEPKLEDKETNLRVLSNYVGKIDSDLIVFPELATSGYYYTDKADLFPLADDEGSDTLDHFQKLASEQNKIIVFGFAEKSGSKLYNSAAILFPDSNYSTIYRKNHLFYKEKMVFEPGDKGFFVIEYKGINIGPMICYDWRFPEASRTLALKGADIIVCPSNLVTNAWQNVMSSRALENKVYIAVANRIGSEERNGDVLTFNGESVIHSYNGDFLAKASAENEEVISAEIFPEKTRDKSFNEFNDIFKDRRPDIYL